MKNTMFKHKFLTLFACLTFCGLSYLQAQTTPVTQAMVDNALATGDPITGVDIEITTAIAAQNTGTARTLTITATGNVIISSSINLSGIRGALTTDWNDPATLRAGTNGHNLIIKAGGNVIISDVINTSGGAGENAPAANDRSGGKGGNAGNVTIESDGSLTINSIRANGGGGGNAEYGADGGSVGAGGNAGKITIDAKANISTNGSIEANAGNAFTYLPNAKVSAPQGVVGGTIAITSGGTVTIGGQVSANGGKGAGRRTDGNNQPASTNGGTGGEISISSCGSLIITDKITANGGEAGEPMTMVYGDQYNIAGAGGAGGKVILVSSNEDVTTALIQVNGMNGADISCPGMQGDGQGGTSNADYGGDGGAGGEVSISAPKGALTVNATITANAGRGGNHCNQGCGGNGANGGNIHLRAAIGNESAILTLLEALGGNRGTNTSTPVICTKQAGVNGTADVVITPFALPTFNGDSIKIDCDEATGEVIAKTITKAMLEALLNNYSTMQGERWEIFDGNNWKELLLPVTVNENNKETYSAYIRFVYTECGAEKRVEKALIYISCAPIPEEPPTDPNNPTDPEVPEDELFWPNAITPYNSGSPNAKFMEGLKYQMYVSNRYGQTVFKGKGGWDGKYKGKIVDPGTYYYVVELDNGEIRKATIEVVKE